MKCVIVGSVTSTLQYFSTSLLLSNLVCLWLYLIPKQIGAVVAQWVTCWIFSQTEKISFGGPGFEPCRGQKFQKEFQCLYPHITALYSTPILRCLLRRLKYINSDIEAKKNSKINCSKNMDDLKKQLAINKCNNVNLMEFDSNFLSLNLSETKQNQ